MRFSAILGAAILLSGCEAATATGAPSESAGEAQAAVSVTTLAPAELAELLAAGNIRLIDVRTDEEVAEGMIPGAEHIALDDFDPATLDQSDGREVILYCRSDRRSGIAAERLAAHTGATVRHLDGGILAWEEEGLPIAGR